MNKPKSQHYKVGPVNPSILLVYKQFIDEMQQPTPPSDSPTSRRPAAHVPRIFPRARLAIRKWLIKITRRAL